MTRITAFTAGLPSQLAKADIAQGLVRAARAAALEKSSSLSYAVSVSSQALKLAAAPATQKAALPADYTNTVKLTKDKTLNPLLAGGNHWWHTPGGDGSVPSAVATHALTYSFMSGSSSSTNFAALTDDQKTTVREALAYISSVANVSFSEVGSGGNISYGTNDQTLTHSAGYASYPNDGGEVFLANNVSSFSASWDPGSFTWATLLHETGHALGLKHPGNYNAGGGGTPGPYLTKTLDNQSSTIMSYNNDAQNMKRISYNGSAFATSNVNPDSFQTLDIAALQYLYGAPTSVTATTYTFTSDDIFSRTIWNSNPDSALDLSQLTANNVVDSREGKFSSIGIRDPYSDMDPYFTRDSYALLQAGGKKLTALVGIPTYSGANNLAIARGSHINSVTGGSGNDIIITNADSNTVDGGDGNDAVFVSALAGGAVTTVTGGTGDDTVYVAKKSGALWTLSGGTLTLTQTDKKTNVVTTLATVDMSGVEHVNYWNGKAIKSSGTLVTASASAQKKVLAYASAPASAARIRGTA